LKITSSLLNFNENQDYIFTPIIHRSDKSVFAAKVLMPAIIKNTILKER
jgi:hypothetical protein